MVARVRLCALGALFGLLAAAQVIEFESGGLHYQTLTRRGVTVMFAHLPAHVHDFFIVQVAVSNGSQGPYTIRPEDFRFVRADGAVFFPHEGKPLSGVRLVVNTNTDTFEFKTE